MRLLFFWSASHQMWCGLFLLKELYVLDFLLPHLTVWKLVEWGRSENLYLISWKVNKVIILCLNLYSDFERNCSPPLIHQTLSYTILISTARKLSIITVTEWVNGRACVLVLWWGVPHPSTSAILLGFLWTLFHFPLRLVKPAHSTITWIRWATFTFLHQIITQALKVEKEKLVWDIWENTIKICHFQILHIC